MTVQEDAEQYLKLRTKDLLERFASLDTHPAQNDPHTIFMAGAPGAGKTEASQKIISNIPELAQAVRIDADEIKEWLPQYNGKNSDDIQGASVLGLQRLYDTILSKKQHAIVDGTFSEYKHAKENIERSLKRNRVTIIIYIYQDPRHAWAFTKLRAEKYGRSIPKEYFIDTYFKSIETVNRIKAEFGQRVYLYFIEKNYFHEIVKFRDNVQSVDSYIKKKYTKSSLEKIII